MTLTRRPDVKAYLSSQPEGIPDEITRVNQMHDAAPRMEISKVEGKTACVYMYLCTYLK
jgi:hypothetical protein